MARAVKKDQLVNWLLLCFVFHLLRLLNSQHCTSSLSH